MNAEAKSKLPSNGSAEKKNTSPSSLSPVAAAERGPVEVTIQTLLEAGVHYGHQTSRWHPHMAPFIYGVRNGIHIINLPLTIRAWKEARKAIVEVAGRGGNVLFVGTKKQAQSAIMEEAQRCGAFFVSRRWLGGMITNFQTIRKSIERLRSLEALLANEEERKKYTKKELLMMDREREKLEFSLGGIKEMRALPQILFVVDTKREDIAIKEARRADIPVVALADTNTDPKEIEFPIPSNDDASRAIGLFAAAVADAVLEGKERYQESLVSREREGHGTPEVARSWISERQRDKEAKAAEAVTTESAPAEAGSDKEKPAD